MRIVVAVRSSLRAWTSARAGIKLCGRLIVPARLCGARLRASPRIDERRGNGPDGREDLRQRTARRDVRKRAAGRRRGRHSDEGVLAERALLRAFQVQGRGCLLVGEAAEEGVCAC
eukprot:6178017-Pleurochrysis_carterae.AAC.1